MLNRACRSFRKSFHPGMESLHRQDCPACAAYAAALERAAGVRLPLPPGLRERLRAVGGPEPLPMPRSPLPQRPLPAALRGRLQDIAREGGPRRASPPPWVVKPRYAIAASYLLALVLTGLLGDPVSRGLEATSVLTEKFGSVLEQAEETGEERIRVIGGSAAERYVRARRTVSASLEELRSEFAGLAERLPIAIDDDTEESGARDETRRPARRLQ